MNNSACVATDSLGRSRVWRVRIWQKPTRCTGRPCKSPQAIHASASLLVSGRAAVAKQELLQAIEQTERGLRALTFQRALIEEAQVAVEACSGPELDLSLLEGKWKLVYTTARDVLPILEAEYLLTNPFGPRPLLVGDIFQQFSCPEVGKVQNVIQLGVPLFLEDRNSLTLTVEASYEVRSPHRIALVFDEAKVSNLKLSATIESLLAPALLPRGSFNHQLLLAIKELQLRFPFRSLANGVDWRRVGANYQITYLDENMLIGRASQLGGSFIFTRAAETVTA